MSTNEPESDAVAIIGMAGRFPGARNIDEFWQNLCNGSESVTFFTDQELIAAGVDEELLISPAYVRARAVLEDADLFDAAFFGLTPREAEILDPQQRVFLECAWEALEHASYCTDTYPGRIGVYAGASLGSYLLNNLLANRDIQQTVNSFQIVISNDKDFLTTRTSYKLNLRGPSVAVQTACSTSLVAVHMACQSLLNGDCDIALAGGVAINIPQKIGYLYQEGSIVAPDGHCRAFDAAAQGTISGDGVGIVVLKRLEDAITDRDTIHAVIRGSAINNDGSVKIGYTAPSVDGQAEVIVEALAIAGFAPETVTYVEAHGTGTPLGDPIEIAALTQAFRLETQRNGFCALGSVKTNIGHLDTAAGVAGLIKTILALKNQSIPPSLHFAQANPKIDFENSPFYVNTTLSHWGTDGQPRRAGVSSFGLGGTNAHVLLEEAPPVEPSAALRSWHLLILSARSNATLSQAVVKLALHLRQHPDLQLADVAYTLQLGRKSFDHRQFFICQQLDDAVAKLETWDARHISTVVQTNHTPAVVFLFPGQGSQYHNMARDLYIHEPVFRDQVDLGAEILKSHLGFDIRSILYATKENDVEATRQLMQTSITQLILFVIEYALAKLLLHWGIRPQAMIGHSIGEYVAACLAGVFSFEDALALVAIRGQFMQTQPTGLMLAVHRSAAELVPWLGTELSLAALNSPSSCVISGSTEKVRTLEVQLVQQGITCHRLHVSHAFHSHMMDTIVAPFVEKVKGIALQTPKIPYISNLSGTWIRAQEATDPAYWGRHLRQTVRFAEGIEELLQNTASLFVEVGPGHTLSHFVQESSSKKQKVDRLIVPTLKGIYETSSDQSLLLTMLGRLWQAGVVVDWEQLYSHERRRRIPLPTYPFERQRYWIEPDTHARHTTEPVSDERLNITDWCLIPSWKRSPLPASKAKEEMNATWSLLFAGNHDLGIQIARCLEAQQQAVLTIMVGKQFARIDEQTYTINPQRSADYDALLQDMHARHIIPERILHFWLLTHDDEATLDEERLQQLQDLGFYSLLFLAQAVGKYPLPGPIYLDVISNGLQDVTGEESLCPAKATVLGPCRTIPQEYSNIFCRSIDISLPVAGTKQMQRLISLLLQEIMAPPLETIIAYRGVHRLTQTYEPLALDPVQEKHVSVQKDGVYLITGGLGGIGLELATCLAQNTRVKLILLGRSFFPQRAEWEQWLAMHEDDIAHKIRMLLALEKLHAKLLVVRADVTNQQQMQSVIAQAQADMGAINGVIHTAGIVGGGSIQLRTSAEAAKVLSPKVRGTQVLASALHENELDFFILCSSISSLLGEPGMVDYCAANAFLDAFAHYNTSRNGSTTMAINWDRWQQTGMARITMQPKASLMQEDQGGITPEEGRDIFRHLLESEQAQVVVSARHFPSSQNYTSWMHPSNNAEVAEEAHVTTNMVARSQLTTTYLAPHNDIERRVADIWQGALGIEPIGIQDNFFELGGHSVIALHIITRLQKAFTIDMGLTTLFEHPTIAMLATLITATLGTGEKSTRQSIRPISRNKHRVMLSTQEDVHLDGVIGKENQSRER